ncbi:MAG: bi-domain-containing oxidoreductase [Pseudomonadota bacterium]
MKQVCQNLGNGETELMEVPAPIGKPNHVVIETQVSLLSAGTERMLVDFGRASLIQKARMQPDKVRQVLNKVSTDGLATTYSAVKSKLDQPLPLGYCNMGRVISVGAGVSEFSVGDLVVSNGPHAEVVRVGKNLCVRVPEGVAAEHAPFAVVGAIGLQGIRLARPEVGETFAVIGLGLIGLLTVQILKAAGCKVLGIDLNESRLEAARGMGADVFCAPGDTNPVDVAKAMTGNMGVDGVLVTAATSSNDPMSQAAQMCRVRGRIVLVGTAGLELSRAEFYDKEISFQVSCSYGPGRYDPVFEEQGVDYPFGYVRWTQQRNIGAVLDLMAMGKLDVSGLITHQYTFDEALAAYDVLTSDPSAMGVVLNYPSREGKLDQRVAIGRALRAGAPDMPVCGVIGGGNFASRVLMPAIRNAGGQIGTVATTSGLSAAVNAHKFEAAQAATGADSVIDDADCNIVFILTRHDTHADLVHKSLLAGKHVFVEKPLAIHDRDLDRIESVLESVDAVRPILMVGYNRRFSPYVSHLKSALDAVNREMAVVYTVNAGHLPPDHWIQDPAVGGGRIIGEGCHFIDLCRHLTGAPISDATINVMRDSAGAPILDTAMIQLAFENGSIATIQYLSNGPSSFPKERVEVFCGGDVWQLDNFRRLTHFGPSGRKRIRLGNSKGHAEGVASFLSAVKAGGEPPIPENELLEVARQTIRISDMALGVTS